MAPSAIRFYDLSPPRDDRTNRWKPLDTAPDLFGTIRPIDSLTFDPVNPHIVTGANEFDALFGPRASLIAPDRTTRVFFMRTQSMEQAGAGEGHQATRSASIVASIVSR